ncbi:class I SAM-dependent methyltransferase [Hydrogenophaga sp.]|mgnify:CR=1 FL=1|uniref:class I SAM-dependent methyltransferase n=1 Tax=Hydrogenophaga sp. TaxID=1904254 RepID=UPI002D05D145|nr:class I SAM-dependent methyltransferase [Hydrogenophaga sp.]HMP09955.1 class I SAM-dependent methyltransferase [Hydrogenophaga sp.]
MLRPSSAAAASVESPALSSVSAALARKARFWDRIARKYAADPIADLPGYEATLQRVQGLLSANHDVLEIGCGTGSTALRLAPHTRRLLATDVSAEMIAIARDKLAAQPMPQLGFAVADADAPVFGQGAWDAVLAFNLLHLVDDLDHAIDAAAQALRPGGLFISKTACIKEMNPLVPRLALPLMRAIGKAPHVLCFDAAQLQATMLRHGLIIEAVERHGTRGKDIRVFIVARRPAGSVSLPCQQTQAAL